MDFTHEFFSFRPTTPPSICVEFALCQLFTGWIVWLAAGDRRTTRSTWLSGTGRYRRYYLTAGVELCQQATIAACNICKCRARHSARTCVLVRKDRAAPDLAAAQNHLEAAKKYPATDKYQQCNLPSLSLRTQMPRRRLARLFCPVDEQRSLPRRRPAGAINAGKNERPVYRQPVYPESLWTRSATDITCLGRALLKFTTHLCRLVASRVVKRGRPTVVVSAADALARPVQAILLSRAD